MTHAYKTLKATSKIAMSFVGRTYARLRHIQKMSKMRVDAVQLIVKDAIVSIYLDGRLLLKATREMLGNEWKIDMTHQLKNLLDMQVA